MLIYLEVYVVTIFLMRLHQVSEIVKTVRKSFITATQIPSIQRDFSKHHRTSLLIPFYFSMEL